MFEQFSEEAARILSVTICGVSIGAILFLTLYVIKVIRLNRHEISIRKDDVERAFKEAILPKNIKIDVSGKVSKSINEGIEKMDDMLETRLVKAEKGIVLILTILNEFTHVQKLPVEIQEQIEEYIDKPSEEIIL